MSKRPRLFTLEEANALLPELEGLLAKLTEKKEAYEREHDMYLMSELLEQSGPHFEKEDSERLLDQDAKDLDRSVEEYERDVSKIQALGCVVRNAERGWVEFLSKIEGKLVYLSWRRGEKVIRHYRFLREGKDKLRAL